ncbi:MAG: hypothetical protein FWC42_08960 [Proteobacteria bacterium]|nr:hypothetical protein [Pseudomonadota bacterium]
MKHRRFLLLILFSFSATGFAADVIVQDRSGWRSVNAEQETEIRQGVLQVQPDTELLNLSVRDAGGLGAITRRKCAEGVINQKFIETALAGFLDGTSHYGYAVESREPATLGPLSGFHVITSGNMSGTHFTAANWLLFAKRDFYVVTVYDFGDPRDLAAMEAEYSSRIQFSPAVEPPLSAKDSTKGPGYEAGYVTGKFILPIVLLIASVVLTILLVRLR